MGIYPVIGMYKAVIIINLEKCKLKASQRDHILQGCCLFVVNGHVKFFLSEVVP
jgi:hypothetical protein